MDMNKQKYLKKSFFFLLVFCIIIEIIIVICRAWYGTEVTDEALYLSMANQILQGRVPFADIWFVGSGSALCYAWVIALYKIFVPQLDGVFLLTRVIFHIVRIIIIVYGFLVLKKKIGMSEALLAAGILVPYYTLIGNFSYNSVPIYLMILAGFLTIDEIICVDKCEIRSFMAGIFVALAVYSHPCEFLNVFVIGAVILFFSEYRLRNCLVYVGGGILSAVVIGIWSSVTCGGLDKFVYGIKVMLNIASGMNKVSAYIYIQAAFLYIKVEVFSLFFVAGITFIGALVYTLFVKQEKNFLLCRYTTTISILCWFIWATLKNAGEAGYPFYIKFGAVIMLATIAVFIVAVKDRINCIIFGSLSLTNIVFCSTNGLLAGSGIITRMYVMIPCIIAYILITMRMLQLVNVREKISICIELSVFLMTSLLYSDLIIGMYIEIVQL